MIIGDSLRNQAPTHISNIFFRWHCDRLHSGLMVGSPLPWLHNYWYIRFWRKKIWMKSALEDAPQFLLPFPTHFLTNMPFDVTWIFVVPCSVSVIGACYMPSCIWPAINRESLLQRELAVQDSWYYRKSKNLINFRDLQRQRFETKTLWKMKVWFIQSWPHTSS